MKRRISLHSVKSVPQRTCIACRKVKAKHELIRLVRVSDGGVEVDTDGKKAGRGAYLCRAQECWETGFKGGRLEHTLRTTISQNNREQLIGLSEDLLSNSDAK